ncbi:MAG: hypothetical protein INR73_10050 [Williamsia sp.]|nr:hypothetical protein [Williamsia sp.]
MERIRTLINKLQQQADQGEGPAAMMVTVQMLQAELSKMSPATQPASTSKISVVLPGGNVSNYIPPKPAAEPEKAPLPAAAQPAPVEPPPVYTRAQPDPRPVIPPPAPEEKSAWVSDPLSEMPALAEQKKEMNEAWGKPAPSLNDKLKTETTELGSVLKDTPVKDLKKAIGINDRFVFLHELFRGDEAMYERSIKTINNFRAYPEAEFWIERELKIKLGWDESKDSVKYFRQLVKRRFV